MATKISEDTNVQLDLKTIAMIVGGAVSLASMWFTLQGEISDYYWDFTVTSDLLELRNLATVAELIVKSALNRRESRGLHYTLDYPEANDKFAKKDTLMNLR